MKSTSQSVYSGPARAPHRSLLRALGVGRDDADRPLIGIANSYNELIPGPHAPQHHRSAGEVRRVAGGRYAPGVQCHRGLRRHRHEPRGHALLTGVARGHRRLGGDHGQGPRPGRSGAHPQLRQDRSGHGHGRCPSRHPGVVVSGGPMLAGDYRGARSVSARSSKAWAGTSKARSLPKSLAELEDASVPPAAHARGSSRPTPWAASPRPSALSLPGDATIPAPFSARFILARRAGRPRWRWRARVGRVAVSSPRRAFATRWPSMPRWAAPRTPCST